MTSCSNLSDHVGMPSGRNLPFAFGISTRRTGVHRYRSFRSSSMMPWIFSADIPSTVSSVAPRVIAPAFLVEAPVGPEVQIRVEELSIDVFQKLPFLPRLS